MNLHLQEEQTIRRYLLGQLPVDEREKLEERLFADKDLLATIDVINDELTDEYVFDELSNADRIAYAKAFETQPERRTQERLANALRQYGAGIANGREEKARWFSNFFLRRPAIAFAMGAALLITSISSLVLFYKVNSLQNEIVNLNSSPPSDESARRIEELTARNDELQKQLANEQARVAGNEPNPIDVNEKGVPPLKVNPNSNRSDNPASRPAIATFLLKPGLVRDGGQTRITLNPSVRSVNLQPMLLQNIYPRYGATLSTVDGKNISTFKSLTARNTRNGAVLYIQIAAELLQNADYILKVNGALGDGAAEEVASYSFRIIRQP